MEKIIDEQLIEKTKPLKNWGIGLHGIRTLNTQGKNQIEVAESIMEQGLKLGNRYRSINGNVFSIGISGIDDANIADQLVNYNWGNEKRQTNIIVAYPAIIENSKGEKLYLGYTQSPKSSYDQDTICSFMDIACSNLGYIPKEFILGYYTDFQEKWGTLNPGEHITYDFESNPNFCSKEQVSDELFDTMSKSLMHHKSLSMVCANAIDKLDITELESTITSRINLAQRFNMSDEVDFLNTVCEDVKSRIQPKTQQNNMHTLQQIGKETTSDFYSNPPKAIDTIVALENEIKRELEKNNQEPTQGEESK